MRDNGVSRAITGNGMVDIYHNGGPLVQGRLLACLGEKGATASSSDQVVAVEGLATADDDDKVAAADVEMDTGSTPAP